MSARNNDPWTVQKRFGFGDSDLKTSEHDEIMMWADEKMPKIVNYFFKPDQWNGIEKTKEYIERRKNQKILDIKRELSELERYINNPSWYNGKRTPEELKEEASNCQVKIEKLESFTIPSALPNIPNVRHEKTIWEFVITTQNNHRSNKYTVGFIDLAVKFHIPILTYDSETLDFEVGYREASAFFEVKSNIDSLGQLIRQVRLYQQYTGEDNWFVIAPDDSFKKQLENQNIRFIKYTG